jgi:hypothetical protein
MDIINISLLLIIISTTIFSVAHIIQYFKIKSLYVNLYKLSKGLDILFSNQEKILELTKLKTFVQLTTEEEKNVKREIDKEKEILRRKETEDIVRPSESNQS